MLWKKMEGKNDTLSFWIIDFSASIEVNLLNNNLLDKSFL